MAEEIKKEIPLGDDELDSVTGGGTSRYASDSLEAGKIYRNNCPKCGGQGTVSGKGAMKYACSQCNEEFRLTPAVDNRRF